VPEILFMFPPGKPAEALYVDGVDFNVFGNKVEIVRNSHVEPVPGGTNWMIVWQGEFVEMFGVITTHDDEAEPFPSHAAAVNYEKRLLLRHHYKV